MTAIALLLEAFGSLWRGDSLWAGGERFGRDPYADLGGLLRMRPLEVRQAGLGWAWYYDRGLPPGARGLWYGGLRLEDPFTREPLPILAPQDAGALRWHPALGFSWADRPEPPEPLTVLGYHQALRGGLEAFGAAHAQRLYGSTWLSLQYGLGSDRGRWPGEEVRNRTVGAGISTRRGPWRWTLRYAADAHNGRSNEGWAVSNPPAWSLWERTPPWIAPQGRTWRLRREWARLQALHPKWGEWGLVRQFYRYAFETRSRRFAAWSLQGRFRQTGGDFEWELGRAEATDSAWPQALRLSWLEVRILDTIRPPLWAGMRLRWGSKGGEALAGAWGARLGRGDVWMLGGWMGPDWEERGARGRQAGIAFLHLGGVWSDARWRWEPFVTLSRTDTTSVLVAGAELSLRWRRGLWGGTGRLLGQLQRGAPRALPELSVRLEGYRDFFVAQGAWRFRLEAVLSGQSGGCRSAWDLTRLRRWPASGPGTPPGLWLDLRLFAQSGRAWPYLALDNALDGLPGVVLPTAYRPLDRRRVRWGLLWELSY
ncbi:MAG: hypothetical protein N2561_00445 [Bacteroidetes bacterium]|nr:hypothetical protein [Bacteroidota bacterium]MDW8138124.1 hypothetical protein [Bacteroidota bacterium]